MRAFLTVCLLLISTLSIASAQQSRKRQSSLNRAEIREAERRLRDLGYWTAVVDGRFDPATQSALIAFQKWEGRSVTGKLTLAELEAIRTSAPPKARETGYAHVEVDIDRQVLMIIGEAGELLVLPVSTGSGREFIDQGQKSIAYTPGAGSSCTTKLLVGKPVGIVRCITQTTSAAAWPSMVTGACPTSQRVMVASGYQSSRPRK